MKDRAAILARAAPEVATRESATAAAGAERRSQRDSRETRGDPLFVNYRGTRLTGRSVDRLLRRYVAQCSTRHRHQPACAAPLVCDPSAAARRRPARDPGAARPRAAEHHAALHARQRRAVDRRLSQIAPPRRRRASRIVSGACFDGFRPALVLLTRGFLLGLVIASAAFAQAARARRRAGETVNLFGFKFTQNERFKFGGELIAGWSHDGAQAALGFEKQGRVGMAILSLSGRVSRSRPLSTCPSTPSARPRPGRPAARRISSFPNDPQLYAAAGRSCRAMPRTA